MSDAKWLEQVQHKCKLHSYERPYYGWPISWDCKGCKTTSSARPSPEACYKCDSHSHSFYLCQTCLKRRDAAISATTPCEAGQWMVRVGGGLAWVTHYRTKAVENAYQRKERTYEYRDCNGVDHCDDFMAMLHWDKSKMWSYPLKRLASAEALAFRAGDAAEVVIIQPGPLRGKWIGCKIDGPGDGPRSYRVTTLPHPQFAARSAIIGIDDLQKPSSSSSGSSAPPPKAPAATPSSTRGGAGAGAGAGAGGDNWWDRMCGKKKVPVPLPTPKPNAITFSDPRTASASVGVIAFYMPGYEEEWDKLCGGGFMGNFWEIDVDGLKVTANDVTKTFTNSEAAFQTLKFWNKADDFRTLTGNEAFQMKKEHHGFEDFTYAGFGSNWSGMLAVLKGKFVDIDKYKDALMQTEDAYLLEHNSVEGRDQIWSNNSKGDGLNWLGLQLMLLRDEIKGTKKWTDWITGECGISLENGAPATQEQGMKWQAFVQSATDAVKAKLPTPLASMCRGSCGKPTWNGQPNEFCSRTCRTQNQAKAAKGGDFMPGAPVAGGGGALCLTPGCGKSAWNGKPGGHCSIGCRGSGPGPEPSGRGPPPTARASAPAAGAASGAPECLRPGCGKASWNGQPNEFCSRSCKIELARGASASRTGAGGAGSGGGLVGGRG